MKYIKQVSKNIEDIPDDNEIEYRIARYIDNHPSSFMFIPKDSNDFPGFYSFIIRNRKEFKGLGYKVKREWIFSLVGVTSVTLSWEK